MRRKFLFINEFNIKNKFLFYKVTWFQKDELEKCTCWKNLGQSRHKDEIMSLFTLASKI